MIIRQATTSDAAALLDIYRPIVENTAISFELVAPTIDEFPTRIKSLTTTHEWLVKEGSDAIAGYAYASPHRPRKAYKRSIETSVYVNPDFHGRGLARKLYAA